MKHSDIATFMAIVQQKNLSQAANTLFITQSTISQRLSKLENEVGGKLFIRKPGVDTVELTQKAELFLPLAIRMLEIWKEIDMLKESCPPTLLTIGSIESLATVTLNPLFEDIVSTHNNLRFRLITGNTEHLYNMLDQRIIDTAFITCNIINPRLISTPILVDPMCIISTDEDISSDDPIDITALDTDKEIFFSWSSEFKSWHQHLWSNYQSPFIYVDTTSLYLQFVATRKCWSICPLSMAKYLECHLKSNLLYIKTHTINCPPPSRVIYMVTHTHPLDSHIAGLHLLSTALTRYKNNSELLL